MNKIKPVFLSILVMLTFVTSNLYAATTTDQFTVTASVADECTVTANDLAFGVYSIVTGAEVDATTTIDVTCSNGTVYNIGLDAGDATGATITARKLTRVSGGTETLNYGLFSDSGYSTNWGDTVPNGAVQKTGDGSAQETVVYGKILPNQTVPVASYDDVITVTITYGL